MKKIIFTLAITLLAIQQHQAQTTVQGTASQAKGDMMFGVKAGLNISTFLGRDYVDITPRVGAYLGGLVEIPITDKIYFQPEAILSFQGADLGAGNLNLTYLHLPIMGKYHITEAIAVELGPQIGVLIGDNGNDYVIIGGDPDVRTKSLHLGFNVGGGYRLDENIYFQARFSVGLSKVIEDTKTRNGVLQIGACYFF